MKKVMFFIGLAVTALYLIPFIILLNKANSAYIILIPIISAILAAVCSVIAKKLAVKNADKPHYTPKQRAELANAAKKDNEIKEKNRAAESAARDKHERELPAIIDGKKRVLAQKVDELHGLANDLKAHLKTFSEMDALTGDDKSLQTVDCLIYFMETRRADSIKEALHEYDKTAAANQLAALERQRVELLQKQVRLQQEQMARQDEHNRKVESTIRAAAASAEQDRARQRDIMYVNCLNMESRLGSIAKSSGKIADMAELYTSRNYY